MTGRPPWIADLEAPTPVRAPSPPGWKTAAFPLPHATTPARMPAANNATDPRRRMWHWLLQVKDMGFSGVNNFPTHCIVDGQFRQVLEETGMSVKKEFEMVALARKMDLFSIVYVSTPDEAKAMAESGADAIIAHVGTTVGGSIGVRGAVVTMKDAVKRTQAIIDGARSVRKDIIFLSHGGPIAKPEDAAYINEHTDCVGFVGASSLERLAVEESLTNLTRTFKKIPVKQEALRFLGGGKKQ